jgi:hypothetical protein
MAVDLRTVTIPGKSDLDVVRRDSIRREFVVKESKTGPRVPLTGLSGKAQIRQSPDSGSILVELTVTVDQSGTGPTVGLIVVEALASETVGLPDTAAWDLQITDGTDAFVKTLLKGAVNLIRDVTN